MPRKVTRASWSKESRCCRAGPKLPAITCHPPHATSTAGRRPPAAADQQSAIDELEKIWEAVIPFHPLLARDLADQTKIARSLRRSLPPIRSRARAPTPARPSETKPSRHRRAICSGRSAAALGTESEELAPLAELQERTLRRTQLLKLKAEAELARPETPPPPDAGAEQSAGAAGPKPLDPEQIKAGYQKAIELAPRAVEQMEQAVKALKQNDPQAAYPPAEEARKILEEIQKAQPRKKSKDQKKQDQKEGRGPEGSGQKDQQKQEPAEGRSAEEGPAEERAAEEQNEQKEPSRRSEHEADRSSHSRRSRTTGSKRPCARSASGSRRSTNATA